MNTLCIILCGFIIILLMIIGFMMDEIDKWKRVALNYRKSYDMTKQRMRDTYKNIGHIYECCGLTHADWRDTDGLKRSSERD